MMVGPGVDVAELTLVEVRDALAAGEASAVEVTEAALARAERFAGHNLFITALPENAMLAAAAADRARASGAPLGPLHGVPITVKDNIDMGGMPTTAGSPVFADRQLLRARRARQRTLAARPFQRASVAP